MPDWRPPSDHDAAERARAWLDRQHALVHAQVLQLLGEAPTEAISQALDSSAPAELCVLQRHITSAAQQWRHQPDGTTELLTACDQRGGVPGEEAS
jgi:hypothetical protein